jgi:YjbE family integral membrane protein
MLEELFSAGAMTALFQVIMIDLVLAGDNAIVIGLAAAGLPAHQRGKVIMIGVLAATLMRIGLAGITTQLLGIVGLMLAGGILLLWVAWKMWREMHRNAHAEHAAAEVLEGHAASGAPRKTFRQAVWQIVVADLSMSLDNVLAVGGAAREHPWVLVFGLALSIALMAVAAGFIARLLQKHHWIAYVGLVVILYVALEMVWRGWTEVEPFATGTVTTMINKGMGPAMIVVALGVLAAGLFAGGSRMRRHRLRG